MFAILKKELKTYLLTTTGYIFIGILLFMFSLFFMLEVFGSTNFEYLFFDTSTVATFVIPIITMKMFAEERKNGTEQLIATSPRSLFSIVLGKFLAAMIIILITQVFTVIYYAIIKHFGAPDLRIALTTELGFFLLCMAYISFGMFASSLTENSIVAYIVPIGFFLAMWFLPSLNNSFNLIDLVSAFDKFPTGVIPIAGIIKMLSFTTLFFLLTVVVLQRRKSVNR